ncbi:adenylyltransferase/cytidyltransferase family protein [Nakamurella sp. YIM 132087]|uniref:Adenylyltransferase/cytidyltransferase family protein n=1 Tax=Nakamurella alba TaxID=2665158 RepID=A0A7K1FFA7_9ACTN|nr:adenylyltransferase/cytidyltransferase family protein [Nakamurella alba]
MPIRIGYAPGAYDLFHVGHLNILRHAKERCDFLVAGVVSDEMCELTKGVKPVIPLAERLEVVRSVRFVDDVYAERTREKLDSWRDIGFTHIFKGDDWRGTPKGEKLESDFAAVGVEVVYFPYTVHTSSTQLRRVLAAIANGADAPTGEQPARAIAT